MRMHRNFWIALISIGLGAAGAAQTPREAPPGAAAGGSADPADAYKVEVARLAALSVQSRITTGAPYSAEAMTESTQVLADGNRIATKSIARIYRDGEGRTRREQVDADTGVVRTVTISDPVAGTSYTLDPANRVASRTGAVMTTPVGFGAGGGGGGGRGGAVAPRTSEEAADAVKLERLKQTLDEAKSAVARGSVFREVSPVPMPATAPTVAGVAGGRGRGQAPGETTREDLALQTIEGVPATGTRTTTVIQAGAIGNLQPIKIVSEQWMSPDLKVLVMTRHTDPRTGETIYRLSNIVRAEPDRSLFTVPADYTIKEVNIRRAPLK